MRSFLRTTVALGATLTFILGSPAAAQTFTWNNSAGGNWSVNTNWLGNVVPSSGTGAILVFGDPTPFSGAYTATNNLGAFTVNRLAFTGEALPGFGTPIVVTSEAGSSLRLETFGGAAPTIVQNGSGSAAIGGSLVLVNDTTVGGTGVGLLSFTNATLSGSGTLIVDRVNTNPFGTGGYTVFNPSGVAAFTGGVTLNNGNLVIAGGMQPGIGPLTINAGAHTVQFNSASPQIGTPVQLNGSMTITGSNGAIFDTLGGVNGAGGITISTAAFTGLPNVLFRAANGFTGPLVVRPLGLSPATATFDAMGSASSSEYTAYPGGTIVLDNDPINVIDRLNTAATLTLHNGSFQLIAGSSAPASQSLAVLRTTGQAGIFVAGSGSVSSGQTATLTFGNWDRQMNSTAEFGMTGLGSTTPANAGHIIITTNPGGAVGGGGAPGTITQSILPYAVTNLGTSEPSRELVRYDPATGRIVPLVDLDNFFTPPFPADEYQKNFYALAGTSSAANVKVSDSIGGIHGATTINALVLNSINAFGGTSDFAASIGGSGTLTITSGAVLITEREAGIGGFPYPSPGIIGVSTLAFGNQTGYFHSYLGLSFSSGQAVTSQITGSAGVVVSGNSNMFWTGANTFSGGLTVNSGSLYVTNEAALGSGPLTLAGRGGIAFGVHPVLTDGNAPAFALTRPVTLGPAGGGLGSLAPDGTLTISGQITGSGSLLIGGGLVRLTNTTNNYSGGTTVAFSTLAVSNDAVLGTGNIILRDQSTLQADGPSVSINRSILLQGPNSAFPQLASTFFTNGNQMSISGVIGSPLAAGGVATPTGMLLKAGLGMLNLSATNTYTGQTIVGDPTPTVRIGNSAFAQPGDTMALVGANGSIPLTSQVTVNPGSRLILDYLVPHTNRVGSVPITLNGGHLWLLGGAPGAANAVTESLGTLTVNGGAGNILLAPAGSNSLTLSLGGLQTTAASPGIAVFRGDGLGASAGVFSRVQFATAPTLMNNIIPFAVGTNVASGPPTDFLTIGANGLQLFTGYGSLASPGPTVTAQHAGSATLFGPTSLNALKLLSGSSVNLNGNTLTIGSATQAGAILAAGAPGAPAMLNGGTIAFGTRIASITTTNQLTITSALTGSAGLAKAGPAPLVLAGNGTGLTGPINVGEGILAYGANNALPSTAVVTVNAGAALDFNGFSPTLGGINGFGAVNIGPGNVALSPTSTSTIGGPLSGAGTLTKSGTAALVLAGDNAAFTGTFVIQNGLLRVETPTALGTGGAPLVIGSTSATVTTGNGLEIGQFVSTFGRAISVQPTSASSPAVLVTGNAQHVTISSTINLNANVLRLVGTSFSSSPVRETANLTGQISGTGRLEIDRGHYRLSGNNTYTGGTTFIPSTLASTFVGVGHDNAFGTGPININSGSNTTSVEVFLRADGGARTIANPLQFNATFASLSVVGTNNMTFSGPIDFGARTRDFNTASTGITTLSGVLSNGGISKSGVGILVVTNAGNTASPDSSVSGGVLMVNGTLPALVTVGVGGASPTPRGAVLAGTGTLGGIEIVGGTVNPGSDLLTAGNGIGILSAGRLRTSFGLQESFGTLSFELNGTTPGAGHDQLAIGTAGQASIVEVGEPAGDGLFLQIRLGFNPTGASFVLVDNLGTAAVSGHFEDLEEGATFSLGQFGGIDYFGTVTYLGGTGNDIVLQNVQPIPEPASVIAVCAGAVGLAGAVRRVRRRAKIGF